MRDFVKSAVGVVKKVQNILSTGSGGLEYFLSKQHVSSKEYIVHQWFHLVEGEYPKGEGISYTYQQDLHNMWTEVVAALDDALEAADDAKGKKEAKKAQETVLVEKGEA